MSVGTIACMEVKKNGQSFLTNGGKTSHLELYSKVISVCPGTLEKEKFRPTGDSGRVNIKGAL